MAAVADATGFASAKQFSHVYAERYGRRSSEYLTPRQRQAGEGEAGQGIGWLACQTAPNFCRNRSEFLPK